uniref:SUKH-4 family immunity protein n=1 Tax=Roseihalotalea indica TaxID=2867963 RepID=A0AA49GMH5_9BACT|nr:SUKH-4 family immunity protein [Tunicatimonas sp. TK19036]
MKRIWKLFALSTKIDIWNNKRQQRRAVRCICPLGTSERMKPEEFKKIWTDLEESLNTININRLRGLGLSKLTIDFLTSTGLPDSAAPFLSFAKDSDDIYEGVQKLTMIYDFLESEFEKYVVIGSCSDGDPIVVNTEKNDRIEYLDHEDYFTSRPFNSDVITMAGCLVAYRNFVSIIQNENGEDAFMNSDFTDEQFEKLKMDLMIADSKIMEHNCFWTEQLEMNIELREDNRDEK